MRIAVLADVHGNLDALEAVLHDLAARAPDRIVVLGDHASGPLDAAGTLDRLIGLDASSVHFLRGNHDRWLVETAPEAMGPSDACAHRQLSSAHLRWLRSLPPTLAFDDVFACHGTPGSDTTYWLEEVGADGSVRPRAHADVERVAEDIAVRSGPIPSLVLCGHTHLPRAVALSDGRLIVNPGSVGLPAYGDDDPVPHIMAAGCPHASYALAEGRASGWSVTFRLVPYETGRMARLADANGRPDWAQAIRTGRIVP